MLNRPKSELQFPGVYLCFVPNLPLAFEVSVGQNFFLKQIGQL